MVNYIKARPLKSRIFAKLCDEIQSHYINLLLYTELKLLSKGSIYELREEILMFFQDEDKSGFCELLQNDFCPLVIWHLYSSIQGRNENILTFAVAFGRDFFDFRSD